MRIGKLDRRITIIQPTLSQGTSGEDKVTGWTALSSIPDVWAAKDETRGNVLVENERVVFSQTVSWVIRYRSDLDVSMRIVSDSSQVYSIIGISEESKGRERFLTITTNLLDNEYWS